MFDFIKEADTLGELCVAIATTMFAWVMLGMSIHAGWRLFDACLKFIGG